MIDNSVRATRSFVRQYLADTISRGQEGIAQYASRYTDTMIAALATCMQGSVPPLRPARCTPVHTCWPLQLQLCLGRLPAGDVCSSSE